MVLCPTTILAQQHYTDAQVELLVQAIDYATEQHAGQTRQSGEPYISHPLQVAATLIDWGMDIDSVVAGVLHDTVEDTDANRRAFRQRRGIFGRWRHQSQPGARWYAQSR